MTGTQKLILASGSPRRVELLHQAGIVVSRLMPMDIDETPQRSEHPRTLARRLSLQKAQAAHQASGSTPVSGETFILAADTVVAVGRRIVGKAEYSDEATAALNLLSGRNHCVYTGICLITPDGKIRQKVAETNVRFKRLSMREIEQYVASGQWRGKAGAYAIQGIAGCFVQKLSGSYTNVVGLPLFETTALLAGEGFDVTSGWLEG